jgi:FkbM family methyltransferase
LKKLRTYFLYLTDYLKHGDWQSVVASVKYVLNKSSHSSDRTITTSAGTFFCRKNTNDFQFANYYYEWGVKKYILKRKNEFSVFIDAGACVGDYSILMAQLGKRCFAFELVSDNIKTFRKNLELNQLQDKVKLFPYGLGDADYSASFNFDPVNTGASRINRIKNSATEKAEIRKLDSLMEEMAIDQQEHIFIKLDVEGMEAEAIRGASGFITHYPHLTFIVEEKHSGQFPIQDTFLDIALFEFGKVDELNIYAKKIRNY